MFLNCFSDSSLSFSFLEVLTSRNTNPTHSTPQTKVLMSWNTNPTHCTNKSQFMALSLTYFINSSSFFFKTKGPMFLNCFSDSSLSFSFLQVLMSWNTDPTHSTHKSFDLQVLMSWLSTETALQNWRIFLVV
ncbi:uncharacterized protein LOC110007144 isoform X2 [Amborella trichopoda]|uniref:uncharacterized protein LOC110007144 isoform X2 n=1 Tax=Amborella trichopoda TaxID=13333 RepID=UPI0009C13F81|nr:uncharacterized protein LOC110007144 isoform X2 [Amborella trichopoda]|eukprot:XP_020522118.1 uncharacterized protein LOC110007144 isoform X2 [Amborella trichopoda]